MGTGKITLGEYIKDRTIRIPCYQRGYIWGKNHSVSSESKDDSVTFMLKTLLNGFNEGKDIFVQGITVVESNDGKEFTVIDGQQRSTFFYLLLKTLGEAEPFTIEYDSSCRRDSFDSDHVEDSPALWLKNFNVESDVEEDRNEPTQDVYFFKKTVRLVKKHFDDKENKVKEKFITYILKHVYFLLIPISKELAVSTFTMMNGNKAIMQDYELIKADLLRRASLGTGGYSSEQASEWDNISLRSRYAHEWDRWLHWWNLKEVQLMFNCDNPMGWLLTTVFEDAKGGLFEAYKKQIEKKDVGKNAAYSAKRLFSELRDCQHKFEDVYYLPQKANQFGVIMQLLPDDKNKIKFIKAYFGYSDNSEISSSGTGWVQNLKQVADLLLIGFTYNEIVERKMSSDKVEKFRQTLAQNPIYGDGENNELAYNYLLVRNVERDTDLKRKFDFTIVADHSLEHVYPKSRVLHFQDNEVYRGDGKLLKDHVADFTDEDFDNANGRLVIKNVDKYKEYISRDDIQNSWNDLGKTNLAEASLDYASVTVSEHSIGNLLLLYRNNNSEFGNKLPEEKRLSYFDLSKGFFSSRHLLHTVFSFAQYPQFDASAICKNQLDVIKDIEQRIENVKSLIEENV